MSCPMYLELPLDTPAATCSKLAMRAQLEPKHVPVSQSLQEFAIRSGLAGNVQALAPISASDISWVPPPPELLPVPAADSADAWDVKPTCKPTRTERCQEKIDVDLAGFSALLQSMSDVKLDCEPVLKEIGLEVARLSMKQSAKTNRWWTMPRFPMICPFSAFPINLLPYPPFKLRQRATDANPHSLVDGKYFALLVISTGSININGRCLERAEIDALGKYIHRCKLGPHRPDVAFSLAEKAFNAGVPEKERTEAMQALAKMQAAASRELGKLRWIQEQRLYQLHERLTSSDGGAATTGHNQEIVGSSQTVEILKTPKHDTSKSYSMGSNSTCSFSSAASNSSESEDFLDM